MTKTQLQSLTASNRSGKTPCRHIAQPLARLAGAAGLSWILLAGAPQALAGEPGKSPQQVIGRLAWDVHEVSVGQFRQFARATGFVSRAEREGGGYIYEFGWTQKPGWTWQAPFGRPAADKEPAVHLTFDEAQQACRFFGKRLPTDAEWVSAAYKEQRVNPPSPFQTGRQYRWPNGESAKGSHCLSGCGGYAGLAPEGVLDRGVGHVAVDRTPLGVNGLRDMGGNVWEWVDTGRGSERITRGASWWYGPERQLVDDVATKPRETRVAYIGFRCVQELK
jgi:sulfatase modifying factor 1